MTTEEATAKKTMLKKFNEKYIWTGGFDTKDIPKAAGFRWNPDTRHWWTIFEDIAAKLAPWAEPDLKIELEQYLATKEQSLTESRAESADIDIPAPEGLEYMPFQKAGIQYALRRKNVLFGDDPGLGKTMQAIGVINARSGINNVLVVAPATVKKNWQREMEKWLVHPLTVGIVNGNLPDTDIVIINYDILNKHKDELMARDWDMVIADECQKAKNPKSQRTKHLVGYDEKNKSTGQYTHVLGIVDKADHLAFLTGTPILNKPVELWSIVHTLAPDVFPNFMGFVKRYCDAKQVEIGWGKYAWDFSGASNLEELQEKLRSNFMVRRRKSEVLKELPPKTRQIIELDNTGVRGLIKQEYDKASIHENRLQTLRTEVELAKAANAEVEYIQAVKRLSEASQAAFNELSKERHRIALAKVPQVIDHLKNALEQEEKVIVFAHHHDVIDAIVEAFPSGEAVRLRGDDNSEQRQQAIDSFQDDPNVKLFVGSIQAAGLGITLTASSHVVFAELDWVPGNLTQAEDRSYRYTQKNNVLVQHLVFDGSMDAKMAKTLIEKQEIIDKALDVVQTTNKTGEGVKYEVRC